LFSPFGKKWDFCGIFCGKKRDDKKEVFLYTPSCEKRKHKKEDVKMTVKVIRVGELVIMEYLTEEQEALYKPGRTEKQLKTRRELEACRKEAYAEIRKQYGRVLREEFIPEEDPLGLEFDKLRNKNSLNRIYLGL
jgi:hypothetical protein